jgi:hypothetical protein
VVTVWDIALATVRQRKAGFVAVFVAVLCGSTLLTALGVLFESGLRAGVPPQRYAGAAVVVGGAQALPLAEDIDPHFSERVPLPAEAVGKIAAVPDVDRAVGDVSVPVDLVSVRGSVVIMITLLVVASTLALAIQQRRREFALLRAVGASCRQIHRMVGAEVGLVAGGAAILGAGPGVAVAYLLRSALAAGGVLPADFGLALSPLPVAAAILPCGCRPGCRLGGGQATGADQPGPGAR